MRFWSGETVILRDELQCLRQEQDIFLHMQHLRGTIAREVPGRQTLRFEFNGQAYYRKLHTGVGWGEIVKNLLRMRLPIIGAHNEWAALNRLAAIGVPSLVSVAYGARGLNPARRLSFIVTRELPNIIQLDDYWRAHPHMPFGEKQALLGGVAETAQAMHRAGINHRDLYLCHFLLDTTAITESEQPPRLYLIDLHRAQLRPKVPRRWLVKDLASLYFSAMDRGVTQRDLLRFLRHYFALPLRRVLVEQRALLDAIARRAAQLYQREQRLITRGERPSL